MAKQNLTFTFNLDNRQYNRQLTNVKQSTISVTKEMTSKITAVSLNLKNALGIGLSTAGIVAFGKKLIDLGDNIADGSKRLGVLPEDFQKLSFAAEKSGTDIGSVESAFKKMAKTLYQAEEGSEASIRALEKIGLNYSELKGKKPEEQFRKIAAALANVADHTEKAALAQEIFGRGGTAIIPMLGDYEALAAEIEGVGLMSNEAVAAAEKFKDSITNLETSFQSVVANSGFIEFLSEVTDKWDHIINLQGKMNSGSGGADLDMNMYKDWNWMDDIREMVFGESGEQISSRKITDEQVAEAMEKRQSKLDAESKKEKEVKAKKIISTSSPEVAELSAMEKEQSKLDAEIESRRAKYKDKKFSDYTPEDEKSVDEVIAMQKRKSEIELKLRNSEIFGTQAYLQAKEKLAKEESNAEKKISQEKIKTAKERQRIEEEIAKLEDDARKDRQKEAEAKLKDKIDTLNDEISATRDKIESFGGTLEGGLNLSDKQIRAGQTDDTLRQKLRDRKSGAKIWLTKDDKKRMAELEAERKSALGKKTEADTLQSGLDAAASAELDKTRAERAQRIAGLSQKLGVVSNVAAEIDNMRKANEPMTAILEKIEKVLADRLPTAA